MEADAGVRTGDLIAMIGYLVIVLGVGFWAAVRSKTTEGYFLGGRSVPGWAVGISMLGTAISSITFLAYPGSAFEGNWSRIVPGLMLPLAAVLSVWLFVPFYRSIQLTSAYQFFEMRFGSWGRTYASLAWSLFSAVRVGIILYLLSLALRSMTHWDLTEIVIITGVVITLYTVVGGIEAVIWTDVLQTIVLFLGGIITVIIIFLNVPGGAAEVISQAWGEGKMSLRDASIPAGHYFDFDLVQVTFWVLILNGIFLNIQEMCSDQTRVQRYLAAKSLKGARRAVWITGLGCIPLWALFMFVGTCLYVFYGTTGAELPAGIPNDQVFPRFVLTHVPAGLGGFIIAALMAAAMSSIDSSMNGAATVLTEDIYKRHLAKNRSDRHYLAVGRIITGLSGAFMIGSALWFNWLIENMAAADPTIRKTAVDVGFSVSAIFSGGLGGFFLLGFLTKRANSAGAAIGVLSGIVVIAWLTFSKLGLLLPENLQSNTHAFLIGVFGNLAVFVGGYLASFLFSAPPTEKVERLTWHALRNTTAEAE